MRSKRVRTLCACNRTRDTNAEYNVIRDINADDTAPGIRSPLPVFEPHALPLTHITHRPWFLGGVTQAHISFSIQSHSLAYCAGARNRIRNCINRQKKNNSASRSKRNKYDVRFGGKQRNWTNSLGWCVCVCEWFSLLALQYPWIYVGGFWLIDIHSVDIIYNGIQFALNHSPNASESISNERAYRKRNRKKFAEMKMKQEDSAALAICFIPVIRSMLFFSRSPFFFHVSSYRRMQNQWASITHSTKENLNINFEWIRFPSRYSYRRCWQSKKRIWYFLFLLDRRVRSSTLFFFLREWDALH